MAKYTDHLGNDFDTLSEMARHWNIPSSTLDNRLNNMGLDIKDALTMTAEQTSHLRHRCTDHLGNVFNSKREMCEFWGIDRQVYFARKGLGWDDEKALTTPFCDTAKNAIIVKDHTGKTFKSISQMCKAWDMTRSTYNARIKAGWTIEQALTTPCKNIKIKKQEWIDHLGNRYPSLNKMCETYGISHYTFTDRYFSLGWSLEDSLTRPIVINAKPHTDEFGNYFPSVRDFCHYYNIPAHFMQGHTPTPEQIRKKMLSAMKGMVFGSIQVKKALDWPYLLVRDLVTGYEYVMHLNKILELYHSLNFDPIPKRTKKCESLQILNVLKFPDYKVICNGDEKIMDYWQIIQHIHDTNFGLCS